MIDPADEIRVVDFLRAQLIAERLRDRDLILQFVRIGRYEVHKVPACYLHMIHAASGEELGSINLRIGSTLHIERYAGHIGYAVHSQHRGHHYASRALRLLLPLARELKLDPLWITCDPDNIASRRSCELAGARFIEIVDVPEDCIIHKSGHTRKCRYRLDLPAIC